MLKLAANLDWLFTELPMSARFHAARREGFRAVEGMFFCQHSLDMLRIAQQESGMSVVLMNAPAGDWLRGERGLAALPGRDDEYLNSLLIARRYAGTLGCRQVHVMAGLRDHSVTEDEQLELLVNRLCIACDVLAEKDITVLIEPLNSEDMPGYIINSLPRAKDIIRRVSHQNIGLQFDIYHCQKIHGNVTQNIDKYLSIVKHFQIASVPGRHEPGSGELNETWILNFINQKNFQGWIGCEDKPSTLTTESLRWMKPYL